MTDYPNRFRPGQSGNPRGRPRIAVELREPIREWTPELLERLRAIALEGRNQDATRAIQLLLAYGWGEPRQAPEVKEELVVDAEAVPADPKGLSTQQLEAIRAIVRGPRVVPALVEDVEAVEVAPATALPAPLVREVDGGGGEG
ncbi:MAG: hypothetical protein IT371_09955 [Deltaproteobacteria bacterium]|nr:hypothetical protein [Deltaproteobacteria bacterium]